MTIWSAVASPCRCSPGLRVLLPTISSDLFPAPAVLTFWPPWQGRATRHTTPVAGSGPYIQERIRRSAASPRHGGPAKSRSIRSRFGSNALCTERGEPLGSGSDPS